MAAKSLPLAELQRHLRQVFTEPQGIHQALRKPASSRLLDVIVDAPPLPAEDRLGVYSEAYFLRLLESLAADFPATRRALGTDDFRRLAADYVAQNPSSSPQISDLGEALPEFIKTHPLARTWPFLPDLLALEHAVLRCVYTDRLPPLDPGALQHIAEDAWPAARLILDPSVSLLRAKWPVDILWERRHDPEKKRGHRLARANDRYFLLYRDDAWVQLRVLDQPRWFMLRRLGEGAALGAVCQELSGQFPRRRESLPVMEWFTHWIQAGVIKKIEFQGDYK